MKLDRLELSNVIGLARADIEFKNAVTVIAGNNGAGKTTIGDAISMAFLGKPRRVDLKKDLGQLLHDGAEKGRVSVLFKGSDENDQDGAEFRLPKGENHVSPFDGAAFMPFCLDAGMFARIDSDARRSFLFTLTNCKASPDIIAAKLAARGIAEDIVEDFKPMLRGGFPAACKEALQRATQSKGAWRQITGATWGSVVAQDWKAPKPEGAKPTAAQLETLLSTATQRQKDLENGISFVGQQEGLLQSTEQHCQKLVELEAEAQLLKRRQAKLANTEKDLNEWEIKFPPMLDKLAELKAGSTPLICPCCDKELSMVGGKLEKFAGLKADTKALSDAALQVTNARAAIDTLKKVHANDLRDIAGSESAAKQMAELKAAGVETADIGKLERARESVAKLRILAAEERASFNAMQQLKVDFEKVSETTEKAAAAHADVLAWQKLGEALAPDGIPGEILEDALAPVNQSMNVLSGMCGWQKVIVGPDMSITYGGRLYGLLSESEQWRADTLITLAIAQISRLRLVVLDRFDVMDIKGRLSLLNMLIKLGDLDAMDTMIMIGTMKAVPVVDGVTSVWVDRSIAETDRE